MSRLNQKFLISTGIVLILFIILSLYINANFIERYYLYEEKRQIRSIGDALTENTGTLPERLRILAEENPDMILVAVENHPDNDILNQRLSKAFQSEGISLKKYWLWDQDQSAVTYQGRKLKLYQQGAWNYSLLAEYLLIEDYFVAAAKIVPSPDKTLALVNQVNAAVFVGTGLALFLCLSLLVRKIISPIERIREAAAAIAGLNFVTVDLKTGDELELLADDINSMSLTLQKSHQLLTDKNKQMEELLAHVSHDLKTPITLIKLYAGGIKDGMDDGTFLHTIIVQNLRMEQMTERLLSLAKVQQREYVRQEINISEQLKQLLTEYNLNAEYSHVQPVCRISEDIMVHSDPEAIYLIYSNMITNAMKYSADGRVIILLYSDGPDTIFRIENPVAKAAGIDLEKIWEPFYVAEESRNQDMAGTGLGLSIVKAVCEQNRIRYSSTVQDDMIVFTFIF